MVWNNLVTMIKAIVDISLIWILFYAVLKKKEQSTALWQRRLLDEDFLMLPVGIGNKNMLIEIHYPEEHFTLEEDNLLSIAHTLGEKQRILSGVPILYSFYDKTFVLLLLDRGFKKY